MFDAVLLLLLLRVPFGEGLAVTRQVLAISSPPFAQIAARSLKCRTRISHLDPRTLAVCSARRKKDSDDGESDAVSSAPLPRAGSDDGVFDDGITETPAPSDDEILGFAVDSFLRGDYDREFAEDAPAPHPGLSPGAVVDSALRSLRDLDDPEPSHGAAVLMRFCLPLSRGERWGGNTDSTSRRDRDPWKEIMREALTPSMLARRIRASEIFSCLLDWKALDVTEGAFGMERDVVGNPGIAFVNAALYFGDGFEPVLIQFTLRRMGGVWLITTARKNPKELFVGANDNDPPERVS